MGLRSFINWRKNVVDETAIDELLPNGEVRLKAICETRADRDDLLHLIHHGYAAIRMLEAVHKQITHMPGWEENRALDKLAERIWVATQEARGTNRIIIRLRLNSNIACRGWRTRVRRAREQMTA